MSFEDIILTKGFKSKTRSSDTIIREFQFRLRKEFFIDMESWSLLGKFLLSCNSEILKFVEKIILTIILSLLLLQVRVHTQN